MSTLTAILRERTQEQHAQTEAAFRAAGFLECPSAYGRLLERMAGVILPLENDRKTIAAWVTLGLDHTKRRKSERLVADLCELDLIPPKATLPDELADLTELEFLGTLYVLEGSSLGGTIISREVRNKWGSSVPTGYFNPYGLETGRMWREFKGAMDGLSTSPDSANSVVEGACVLFNLMTKVGASA